MVQAIRHCHAERSEASPFGVCEVVSRSGQAVVEGEGGGCGPILAGRLGEDVGQVVGDGFLAEHEGVCDLASALTGGDQLEDLGLSLGQVGRKREAGGVTWMMRKSA